MKLVVELDTPQGTLQDMLKRAEHFDGVIILGLNKDGSQYLSASRFSMSDKVFLIQFAQSWVNRWFMEENG